MPVLCEKRPNNKGCDSSTKMDFMRLKNEFILSNDNLGRDFCRDHFPILGDLMCLVCLIPDTFVRMLNPVLGPAVLH
jgi:hypothetical protein